MTKKYPFKKEEFVVSPMHSVGKVEGFTNQTFGEVNLDLVVVHFSQSRMTLRIPLDKIEKVGLRKLSSPDVMKSALKTLKSRAQIKRTMWSRRAQEYETKINSGDPVSIAEVIRDLHRRAAKPEQSFSERQIYEQALGRLASEFAAIEAINQEKATEKIEKILGTIT